MATKENSVSVCRWAGSYPIPCWTQGYRVMLKDTSSIIQGKELIRSRKLLDLGNWPTKGLPASQDSGLLEMWATGDQVHHLFSPPSGAPPVLMWLPIRTIPTLSM